MLGLIDSFRDDCEACSKLLPQGIREIDPFGHNFLIIAQGIRILCYRAHRLCYSSSVTSTPIGKALTDISSVGGGSLIFQRTVSSIQVFENKSPIKRTGSIRVFEKHQSERTMRVLSQFFDILNFVGLELEVWTTQKFVCLVISSQGHLFYSLTFTSYMQT